MKTITTPRLNCGAFALLALLSLPGRASEAASTVKDEAGESPTHVLFTGADIRVLHKGKPYPVQDVEGSSLVIRYQDSGKGLNLPASERNPKFAVLRVLTLADRSATVTNYKHEQAYTPGNDPFDKTFDAMMTATAMADRARMMEARVAAEPAKITVWRGGMNTVQIDNPDLPGLQQSLSGLQNVTEALSSFNHAGRMADEYAQAHFDALEVKFELAAEKSIQSAYMVVVAEYHTKDRPKDSESWMVAKSLGEIGPEPRKVWLREGGLPPGYILENVRVHIYERGVEVATNLSENRASLTRDEAHEYLVLDHTSTHKADTMPVQLVLTKLPADWNSRPRDESFNKTFYVKVDKTGHPAGVFEDQACTTGTANSYCDTVLRNQLFLPALNEGTPIDSIARIKLSKLSARAETSGTSLAN